MPSKVYSAAILGLNCQPIEVEVDTTTGLHCFTIVGLPDAAINEAKERVNLAIKNSGASPPHHTNRRVIVNLAPGDLKKEGPSYDLPIAMAFLIVSNQLKTDNLDKKLFIGELSLEGKLRPINGALPITLMARDRGFKEIYLPDQNATEAALVDEVDVYGLNNLEQLMLHLEGKEILNKQPKTEINQYYENIVYPIDFAYIKGQEHVKRALEIAAAGAHNLLMNGPPGTGKTLLAKALISILPTLEFEEALEVTKIFSVAGKLSQQQPLITTRPFRNPHHTSSAIALIGGGTHPKPGEITLAHRGVLFLDEFPEYHRDVLESLRQPLEDGHVTISRASGSLKFPSRFMLIAAMNPCPCGKATDPSQECVCTSAQIARYKRRISGPIIDRIDLHVEVPKISYEKLALDEKVAEESDKVRERVRKAKQIQKERFKKNNILTNAEMDIKYIKDYCPLEPQAQELLKNAVNIMHLSPRAYHRLLKVSRTIADLSNDEIIKSSHVSEALQYRPKEEI